MTSSKARLAAGLRYHPVFFLNPDDGHRRCWVIDLQPSDAADTGTVVAECLGKGMAIQMADALNHQPTISEEPF